MSIEPARPRSQRSTAAAQRHLPSLRPAIAVAVAFLAALAIAACGGSSTATSTAAATANAGLKFAQCMRANGVPDYPDPRGGKTNVDTSSLSESTQVVNSATTKCQKYSPGTNFGPRLSTAQLARVRAGALALAKCMRAHGLVYPDPVVSPGPNGHGLAVGWTPAELRAHPMAYKSPAFKAANASCGKAFVATFPASLRQKKG